MNREMNREMRRGVWKYIAIIIGKGLLPGSLGLELEGAVQAQTDPNLSLEMNCAQALGCELANLRLLAAEPMEPNRQPVPHLRYHLYGSHSAQGPTLPGHSTLQRNCNSPSHRYFYCSVACRHPNVKAYKLQPPSILDD